MKVQHLEDLKNNTKSEKTKRVVEGLLSIISNGEVAENNVPTFVTESLSGLRKQDSEVDKLMNYLDTKEAVSNFGLKSVLESIKNTSLYNTNSDVKGLVEVFEENLNSISDIHLVDSFIKNAKHFRWNQKIDEAIRPMESKIEKYKTFKLLEEAILDIKSDKNSDIYEDDIRKLEYAFYLPENHVRSYIYSTFQNGRDAHPAVMNVLEQMYKIDQSITSNITYFTNRTDGRVSAYERVSPFMVKEGIEYFMMNGSIYENDGKSVKKVSDVSKIDENFVELCRAFSMFESDSEGVSISDGDTEYKVVEAPESEDGYEIKVDGETQVEEKNSMVFENLSTMGTDPRMINLLKYIGENLSCGNIALMDNILTLIPDNGRAVIDVIKCNGTDFIFVNICDTELQHEQLFPVADANIDAVTTDVQNNYGVDLAPFVQKVAGVNEGADISADGENLEAKAAEAEAKLTKEKELKDLKDELSDVETSMDKIEVLDEEYRSEEDIKNLYDELVSKKDGIQTRIMELESELSDSKPVEGDKETIAEKVYKQIEEMRSSKAYEDELENSEDGVVHLAGSPENVTDDISVIPVVEFGKSDNGDPSVNGVMLYVDDKSVDESEELAAKVASKMGADYEVVEENYIMVKHEPTSAEDQLPKEYLVETITDVIEKLCSSDTLTEEGGENTDAPEITEGLGDALRKLKSRIKSGVNKLSTGDNSMVSEEDGDDDGGGDDNGGENPPAAPAAPAAPVPAATNGESSLEGGDATTAADHGLSSHMRVIFPAFHKNSRLAGKSGYIVAVNNDTATVSIDFDENQHDPMEYQPNIPIADVKGYTNDMDTIESTTKNMTTRELVDGIKSIGNFMGESEESDKYLASIKSVLEQELVSRGKGHLVADSE